MADDQGIDTTEPYEGGYARERVGSAVNQNFRDLETLLANVGPDTRNLPVLDAPPTNPSDGDLALAEGTNWDPDGDGIAGYELVIYANGAWTEIIGGL